MTHALNANLSVLRRPQCSYAASSPNSLELRERLGLMYALRRGCDAVQYWGGG